MELARKQELASNLRAEIEPAGALVLVGFQRLPVKEIMDLRTKFRDAGCTYRVVKNSTLRFAVQGLPHEPVTELCKGVTGVAFNAEDPGAPARVAKDFVKEHADSFEIKGGVSDGTLLDVAGVNHLATLPGPRELKAQFLMLLNTPATQMVRVLNASAQSFLYLLNAKMDKDAA